MIPQSFGLQAMAAAVLVAVLSLGIAAAAGYAYLQKVEEVGALQAELKAERDARINDQAQAAAINSQNLEVIAFQDEAIRRFREDAEARRLEVESALARERARSSGLQRMLEAERKARDQIYQKDPSAKAWAEALVPEAIANRLRARA